MKVVFALICALGFAAGLPKDLAATAGFSLNYIPVGPDRIPSSGRIVGGQDATPAQFPWQVSIQNLNSQNVRYHMCGGIVLNSTHIITAAHCTKDIDTTVCQIVAGAHNLTNTAEATQQRRNVVKATYHENYNGLSIVNDIAVWEVNTSFVFDSSVQPLALAEQEYEPADNAVCINSGWGNANPTGGTPVYIPDLLQWVELEHIPLTECRNDYFLINYVTKNMICFNDRLGGKGACNGDSGGPLVCKDASGNDYLAGIVSWGMQPCAQARFPSVYTHASHYTNWLRGIAV